MSDLIFAEVLIDAEGHESRIDKIPSISMHGFFHPCTAPPFRENRPKVVRHTEQIERSKAAPHPGGLQFFRDSFELFGVALKVLGLRLKFLPENLQVLWGFEPSQFPREFSNSFNVIWEDRSQSPRMCCPLIQRVWF